MEKVSHKMLFIFLSKKAPNGKRKDFEEIFTNNLHASYASLISFFAFPFISIDIRWGEHEDDIIVQCTWKLLLGKMGAVFRCYCFMWIEKSRKCFKRRTMLLAIHKKSFWLVEWKMKAEARKKNFGILIFLLELKEAWEDSRWYVKTR